MCTRLYINLKEVVKGYSPHLCWTHLILEESLVLREHTPDELKKLHIIGSWAIIEVVKVIVGDNYQESKLRRLISIPCGHSPYH